MKSPSILIASGLLVASALISAPALAGGLPASSYRPLKLPAYTTVDEALGYVIHLTGAQIVGTVASKDDSTITVDVDEEEETSYTVDLSYAKIVNMGGKKEKREDLAIGDQVVIDGYLAKNSTGMSARRVIDIGRAQPDTNVTP